MKFKSLILLVISLFILFSCDDGIKFDNPNDRNSDAYNPSDTEPDNDSGETDTMSEYDDEKTDTASTNDEENQDRDDSDSGTTPDDADSIDDSGDSVPDESDSDDNSADSVPDDDSDSTDPTPDESDSTPDEDADTDSGDSTPDEDADTDSGDSTPDQDTDADTAPTTPCDPNPCSSVANSMGACTVSGTSYSCGCNSGYFWNDGKCKRITLGNICTGQTKCYNNTEEITCPTLSTADFYGQDAQYAKAGYCYPQSFTVKTVSGKNIVVDNNTGLEWQQTISEDSFIWKDALSHCENLEYGGYSDWRLPTPQELLTIVDNSKYALTIDSTYFPNMKNTFWTGQENSGDTSRGFYFSAYYGGVWRDKLKTETSNVICVRGNELAQSTFTTKTINGNEIVTDSTNNLMWQKNYSNSTYTWINALKYCENLTHAGYNDWRLPNRNEAISLFDFEKSNAPYSEFPDMPNSGFWSSSNYSGNNSAAWSILFYDGQFAYTYSKSKSFKVRCVRSEQINDPCNPNPCNGLANSTQICTQHNAFEYSCGCNNGYFWNGQKCAVLPECSETSGTPCKDSISGLTWSPLASNDMIQPDALNYCDNLFMYGFSDWHLPSIDELRTLIKNCPGTETNGACAISEKNGKLSGNDYSDDCSCAYKTGSYYSKIGDDNTVSPWSSSTRSDDPDRAWYVGFFAGVVSNSDKTSVTSDVRCVRNVE